MRCSNGVVLITTKQGDKEKGLHFELNSFVGFNKPSKQIDVLSAEEYRDFMQQNNFQYVDGNVETDWQNEIMQKTINQSYNFASYGKFKTTNFRISLSGLKNSGLIKTTSNAQKSISLIITQKFFKEKFSITAFANGSNSEKQFLPSYQRIFSQTYWRNPTIPVFEDDGTTYYQNLNIFDSFNPVLIIDSYNNTHLNANKIAGLNSKYSFSDNLNLNLDFSYFTVSDDVLEADRNMTEPNNFYVIYYTDTYKKDISLKPYLIYNKNLKKHNIHYMIGLNLGKNLTTVKTQNWFSSDEYSKFNIFSTFSYNYSSKYFVDFSISHDKQTLVNEVGNSAYIFHGISAAWSLKNEFFEKSDFVNNLKLRASYGYSGVTPYYEDLSIVKINEINTGVDFSILSNRFSANIDYFITENPNLYMFVNIPVPPNPNPVKVIDAGSIDKNGFELLINSLIVDSKSVKWNLSLNFSKYNERFSLDNNSYPTLNGEISGRGLTSTYYQIFDTESGRFLFYLPEYAEFSDDGEFLYYTENGSMTRNIVDAEKIIFENTLPNSFLGISSYLTFSEKYYFNFSARYISGFQIYNATRMFPASNQYSELNCSQEAYDLFSQGVNSYPEISSYFLENGNYFRIDNIEIGANLKIKKLNFNLFCAVKNIFTTTKYTGLDPEINYNSYNIGIDNFNVYPKAVSYIFGLNFKI